MVYIYAELGILDLTLVAKICRLSSIHKILGNRKDTLTRKMAMIQTHPKKKNSTEIDGAQKVLSELGSTLKIQTFLRMNYDRAKAHLKNTAQKTTKIRWKKTASEDWTEQGALQQQKQTWGPDQATKETNVKVAINYIKMRCGGTHIPSTGLKCTNCANGDPTVTHVLVECIKYKAARDQLINEAKHMTMEAGKRLEELMRMDKEKAAQQILGSRLINCPNIFWKQIKQLCMKYVHDITEDIQETTPWTDRLMT